MCYLLEQEQPLVAVLLKNMMSPLPETIMAEPYDLSFS